MKLGQVVYLYLEQLENYTLKIMKKYLEIYPKTWKNHGNIMEFYQTEKVGTLLIVVRSFKCLFKFILTSWKCKTEQWRRQ